MLLPSQKAIYIIFYELATEMIFFDKHFAC